jgi:hypothetical protein
MKKLIILSVFGFSQTPERTRSTGTHIEKENKLKITNILLIPRFASAPSLGSDTQPGQLYFNTTDNMLYVYNGTVWSAAGSDADLSEYYTKTQVDSIKTTISVDTTNIVRRTQNQSISGVKTFTDTLKFGNNIRMWGKTSNVFIGLAAGRGATTGNNNSAFGDKVLTNNTTGNNNSAFGYQSLVSNTTGNNNSAFGYLSLNVNTTGINNSAFGITTLINNTTGSNNSAFGYQALNDNTTGTNSAFGYQALFNGASTDNSAFGYQTLLQTTGVSNSAFGHAALSYTTGNNNSVFGANSAASLSTGSYNSVFGSKSNLISSSSRNVILGFGYIPTASFNNKLIIASNSAVTPTSSTNRVIIDGDFTTGRLRAASSTLANIKAGDAKTIITKEFLTDTLSSLPSGGGITNISTGTGLIGGPITSTGTISADTAVLRTVANSFTKAQVNTSLAGKANTNGSNATGVWNIGISGNAATATSTSFWGSYNNQLTQTTNMEFVMATRTGTTTLAPVTSTTLGTWLGLGPAAYTVGGSAAQYIRGDGALATFPAISSGTVTNVTSANSNITVATGTTTPTLTLASSITSNAASATVLQTARTINGVPFNGSANITVADVNKLPLTGGTVSGQLVLEKPSGASQLKLTHSFFGDYTLENSNGAFSISQSGTNILGYDGVKLYTDQPMTVYGNNISNNVSPTDPEHLVNKAYVDSKVSAPDSVANYISTSINNYIYFSGFYAYEGTSSGFYYLPHVASATKKREFVFINNSNHTVLLMAQTGDVIEVWGSTPEESLEVPSGVTTRIINLGTKWRVTN